MTTAVRAPGLAVAICLFLGAGHACTQQDDAPSAEDFFDRIRDEKVHSDPLVEWRNFGPGMSGYNEKFWPHPTDTDVMFMGPDMDHGTTGNPGTP